MRNSKVIKTTIGCMLVLAALAFVFIRFIAPTQFGEKNTGEDANTASVLSDVSQSDSQTDSQTESDTTAEASSSTSESSTKATGESTTKKDDGTVKAGLFTTTAKYRASHDYCIAVNTKQNIVIVYTKDSKGGYTVPYKAMVCSCGLDSTPTRLGTYYTPEKYRWRYLNGDCYGQYATRIDGHYLFHSVPYYAQDPGKLKYDEYNKLGNRASEGCVRLSVKDAKWIYDNCSLGTCVTLYEDAGRKEPLAKPAPKHIDTSSPNKGWDPTDPNPDNPWKK